METASGQRQDVFGAVAELRKRLCDSNSRACQFADAVGGSEPSAVCSTGPTDETLRGQLCELIRLADEIACHHARLGRSLNPPLSASADGAQYNPSAKRAVGGNY